MALAAAAATFTSYLITNYIVKKYGGGTMSGTLRFIWEGDHLPLHVRDAIDELEKIEALVKKQKKKLNKVDILMETAKLNSVDHDDDNNNTAEEINDGQETSTQKKKHYILDQIPAIEKDLGLLSSSLDSLAAKVDSVQSSGDVDIKRQKRELSRTVVGMMDKVDMFMKDCGVE
eukprot:CAMPEP_0194092222 /NCGR_PEP_ID=MMETSP0149-20130528/45925_1 /TAXON_ID=122233 /ORGANISM="Chaetoceros debilis, Strain MM31A-1" /LENGTH=173 /DNA_ID=CAMNT_0038777093 /DNA_START=71 /DNA_END=592 /DNA_ORIENTATION=-